MTGGLVARREGYAGLVSLDLGRLDQLVSVDQVSMTATLQPGMRGPQAEAALAAHGLTLGHFPQSFEFASIGGFAVTRSSGQNSAGFGRFDQMVVGLRVATPIGELVTGSSPANAAGPDLRQLVMGSEGTFGVVTEVTVRVRAIAAETAYEAWRFESFAAGQAAMRHLAQGQLLPTIIRLSDETETALNLASQSAVGGEGASGCLMIVGLRGRLDREPAGVGDRCPHRPSAASRSVRNGDGHGSRDGSMRRTSATRCSTSGVLVETLETATFWSNTDRVYADVKAALETSLGEGALVLCHVSHVYETGCSLYFTVAAKQGDEPLARWLAAKAAASDAMIAAGATITHHHAVGTDHKRVARARDRARGRRDAARRSRPTVDPTGILNPGVLIP